MNPTDARLAALSRLYRPSAEETRLSLAEHGDGLRNQLHELHTRPTADRADIAARNLEAMAALLRRYREQLVHGDPQTV